MPTRPRNADQARRRYVRYLQLSLSCVSHAVWITAPRYRNPAGQWALTLSVDRLELKTAGGGRVYLSAGQYFHHIPNPRAPGEWKVNTDGYIYHVYLGSEEAAELFMWHWHPETGGGTHMHVGATHPDHADLAKLHLPTGRVSFEAILRFLIEDFGVVPLRDDWTEILSDADRRFREHRSWS